MTKGQSLPDDATIRSIAARIDRPLVLVGMMGVGKSTIGRKLANVLGMRFTDADDEIVEAAAMPIVDIFDRFGEDYFRDGEKRVIARIMDSARGDCVIATGGGAFVQPETRALILEKGIAIWLDAEVETLVERVQRNDRRPLVNDGDTHAIVTEMKEKRGAAYAEAPIHIRSDRGPHNSAVRRILEALDRWL